jgi:hypothetical protein
LVNGTNLVRRVDGCSREFGCYVTRTVQAPDAASAKELAIAKVRAEAKPGLANPPAYPARYVAEEVERLTGNRRGENSAFAWYGGRLK